MLKWQLGFGEVVYFLFGGYIAVVRRGLVLIGLFPLVFRQNVADLFKANDDATQVNLI